MILFFLFLLFSFIVVCVCSEFGVFDQFLSVGLMLLAIDMLDVYSVLKFVMSC